MYNRFNYRRMAVQELVKDYKTNAIVRKWRVDDDYYKREEKAYLKNAKLFIEDSEFSKLLDAMMKEEI